MGAVPFRWGLAAAVAAVVALTAPMGVILPGLVLAGWLLLRALGARPAVVVAAAIGALLLVSPTVEADDYHSVEGAGGGGSYPEVCGPVHAFGGGRVGYRYTHEVGPVSDVSVSAHGAVFGDDVAGTGAYGSLAVSADTLEVGGSLGLQAGRLLPGGDTDAAPVFPSARLRLGPRYLLFLEGAFMDHWAGPLPSNWLQVGVGVGLPRIAGAYEKSVLVGGVSSAGFFLEPRLSLTRELDLSAFLSYGDSDTYQFSGGLRWSFGRDRDARPNRRER